MRLTECSERSLPYSKPPRSMITFVGALSIPSCNRQSRNAKVSTGTLLFNGQRAGDVLAVLSVAIQLIGTFTAQHGGPEATSLNQDASGSRESRRHFRTTF